MIMYLHLRIHNLISTWAFSTRLFYLLANRLILFLCEYEKNGAQEVGQQLNLKTPYDTPPPHLYVRVGQNICT